MTKFIQKVSLHETTLKKIASGEVQPPKRTRTRAARKSSKVKTLSWTHGLDPRIVEAVRKLGIPHVWERIEVQDATTIIIRNSPDLVRARR